MRDLKAFLASAPDGWSIEIIKKNIRHIYFRVYPDKKQVRVSAPRAISSDDLKAAVSAKSPWILKHICFPRKTIPLAWETPSSQKVYFKGQAYALVDCQSPSSAQVVLDPEKGVMVYSRPNASDDKKAGLLLQWYRDCLDQEISILVDKWVPVMGVTLGQFRIKKMKTRWGSYNTRANRIWINLALIRLSPCFLEYVLVHELVHLLEPSHNARFYGLMDQYYPDWPKVKARLRQYSPGV
ncbi:MAG: M48 family metallopeptidase [Desulfobacter sp.]|nr:M48 family metallopeptidase [Desulfobacter sp.]